MTATCRLVAMRLPAIEDPSELGTRLGKHTASCLRCQAEAARYRSLRRHLAALSTVSYPAPEGFVPSVMGRLSDPVVEVVRRTGQTVKSRVVAVAAAGAAVVATAGTLALVRRRLQAPV
ncbi:MAG: hypothetical protein BMS9Abin07_2327 [Acidimicrobiia bacterium]|nr:MAG: hypothetical protein BMS9Abin07_2327 [Acidimicrobiia bacterium]